MLNGARSKTIKTENKLQKNTTKGKDINLF